MTPRTLLLLLAAKCAWTPARSPLVPVCLPAVKSLWPKCSTRLLSTSNSITAPRRASTGGQRSRPFVIGVGGPSGSGKTLLTRILQSNLERLYNKSTGNMLRVVKTSLDVFYRSLTPEEYKLHLEGKVNFDHPDALDDSLIENTLQRLIEGNETVSISGYNYSSCLRTSEGTIHYTPPFDFVILEGTLALHFDSLRNFYDLKIYVDMDLDNCLARRVIRDQAERGRTVEHILKQWLNTVKPASLQFCIPTKRYADVVLRGDVHDKESLSLLTNYIFHRKFNPNFEDLSKQLWPFKRQ